MSGGKKLLGGLLALGIGLTAVTVTPIIQPSKAQIQNSQQQELENLLQHAAQQTHQGQLTEAITTLQQALLLARQLQNKKAEATILNNIGSIYNRIEQPQKALEVFNVALPITKEVGDLSNQATILNNIALVGVA